MRAEDVAKIIQNRAWVNEIETGGDKHMFRMLEKFRTPDVRKLRCRIGNLILFSLMISLLWGCVSNGTENSTEDTKVYETEHEETSLVDVSAETTAEELSNATEENAENAYISGSAESEPMVAILWRRALVNMTDKPIHFREYEDWSQAKKEGIDHLWKQWDEDFEVEAFMQLSTKLTRKQMIYIFYDREYGSVRGLSWHDQLTKITPEIYVEADKYWVGAGYSEVDHYSENERVGELMAGCVLKVSGAIEKTSYGSAEELLASEYDLNGIWGCVLKESGRLYEEKNGTILGRLSGEAILIDYDFEQMVETVWICLDEMEPIKMVLRIENFDDGDYTKVQIDEDAVYSENEKAKAWVKLKFDLYTERIEKNQ